MPYGKSCSFSGSKLKNNVHPSNHLKEGRAYCASLGRMIVIAEGTTPTEQCVQLPPASPSRVHATGSSNSNVACWALISRTSSLEKSRESSLPTVFCISITLCGARISSVSKMPSFNFTVRLSPKWMPPTESELLKAPYKKSSSITVLSKVILAWYLQSNGRCLTPSMIYAR